MSSYCETKQSYEQVLENTGFDVLEFRDENEAFLGYVKTLLKNLTEHQDSIGEVIFFDAFNLHRGVPAMQTGWRIFLRGTTNTPLAPKNEIRKQVNTYISIEAGW